MAAPFRVLTTETFERQARKAIRGRRELAGVIGKLIPILRDDPYHVTGNHKIKKLAGVDAGDGQWRIRFGDYRIRYDIMDYDVVLHSFRDRKEAYR